MIDGMKFSIKGVELSGLLGKRSAWHKERAEILKTKNLKEAQEGMKAAANAAAAAGSAIGDSDVEVYHDVMVAESMSLGSGYTGSPRRAHGGNVEDPVAAIKRAIVFHTDRGAALDFYSKHLVNEATYVLTESEVQRFELIASAEQN